MLSRRILRAGVRDANLSSRLMPVMQRRTYLPRSLNSKETIDKRYPEYPKLTDAEDPEMNGGYINPPRIKRQYRDPYGEWWDPQERRNFGEPVHEDNDMLGMLSPYDYTWTTVAKGAVMFFTAVAAFMTVVAGVKLAYPDKVSYPREYEDGLERELGGPGAVRARKAGDPDP